jgi:hypothetical protein
MYTNHFASHIPISGGTVFWTSSKAYEMGTAHLSEYPRRSSRMPYGLAGEWGGKLKTKE